MSAVIQVSRTPRADFGVARCVCRRRRSAQAGNRGVDLGGSVIMGICTAGL